MMNLLGPNMKHFDVNAQEVKMKEWWPKVIYFVQEESSQDKML
jgi:hypothetical protein